MKSTLIFVLGLLVGAILMVIFPRNNSEKPSSMVSTDTSDKDEVSQWNPKNRKSYSFNYNEPFFLTDDSGEEYRVYVYGSMGSPLKFTWRSASNALLKGEGELFELYDTVDKNSDGVTVKDVGSKLVLIINEHHLEWSARGQSGGWLYYDGSEITIGKKSG